MAMMQTRRRFLTTLSLTGAVSLFRAPRVTAAEGMLETTSVRLMRQPVICIAPPEACAMPWTREICSMALSAVARPDVTLMWSIPMPSSVPVIWADAGARCATALNEETHGPAYGCESGGQADEYTIV